MMSLIQEKTNQASELVQEFGYDCWVTFVRESEINGDPVLNLILGFEVTWHSAFVFDSKGGKTAIVALKDLDFGMTRMLMTFAEMKDLPVVAEVFRSFDNAIEWLNEE